MKVHYFTTIYLGVTNICGSGFELKHVDYYILQAGMVKG